MERLHTLHEIGRLQQLVRNSGWAPESHSFSPDLSPSRATTERLLSSERAPVFARLHEEAELRRLSAAAAAAAAESELAAPAEPPVVVTDPRRLYDVSMAQLRARQEAAASAGLESCTFHPEITAMAKMLAVTRPSDATQRLYDPGSVASRRDPSRNDPYSTLAAGFSFSPRVGSMRASAVSSSARRHSSFHLGGAETGLSPRSFSPPPLPVGDRLHALAPLQRARLETARNRAADAELSGLTFQPSILPARPVLSARAGSAGGADRDAFARLYEAGLARRRERAARAAAAAAAAPLREVCPFSPEITPASRALAESRRSLGRPLHDAMYEEGLARFLSSRSPARNRAGEPDERALAQCTFQPEPRKPIPPPSSAPIEGVRPTSPPRAVAGLVEAAHFSPQAPLTPHERLYAHALYRQVRAPQARRARRRPRCACTRAPSHGIPSPAAHPQDTLSAQPSVVEQPFHVNLRRSSSPRGAAPAPPWSPPTRPVVTAGLRM